MAGIATEYEGRTVVVTGGASGLGAAMAGVFARAGARIVLLDIDAVRVEAQAAELRALGTEAMGLAVDVADRASITAAADAAAHQFGAVHVLCANVGVQQFGAVDRLTDADWQWVLSVNVMGVINTVSAFLPMIRASQGSRHVVLTSSASVFQHGVRMAAYVASKYAVTGYGEVLRQELAGEGINVSLLFPAGMATRHIESSMAARPEALGPSRFDRSDIEAMIASAGIDRADHVATADEAVRGLLAGLRSNERYIITHGNYRAQVEAQQQDILRAFHRMEAG